VQFAGDSGGAGRDVASYVSTIANECNPHILGYNSGTHVSDLWLRALVPMKSFLRQVQGGMGEMHRGREFHSGVMRHICTAPGRVRPVYKATDGRILVALEPEPGFSSPITLVLNWDLEMKK
jgi:hypothetical protein